jgi:hypothetical protein
VLKSKIGAELAACGAITASNKGTVTVVTVTVDKNRTALELLK